jgi:hypothetical protein
MISYGVGNALCIAQKPSALADGVVTKIGFGFQKSSNTPNQTLIKER